LLGFAGTCCKTFCNVTGWEVLQTLQPPEPLQNLYTFTPVNLYTKVNFIFFLSIKNSLLLCTQWKSFYLLFGVLRSPYLKGPNRSDYKTGKF